MAMFSSAQKYAHTIYFETYLNRLLSQLHGGKPKCGCGNGSRGGHYGGCGNAGGKDCGGLEGGGNGCG